MKHLLFINSHGKLYKIPSVHHPIYWDDGTLIGYINGITRAANDPVNYISVKITI